MAGHSDLRCEVGECPSRIEGQAQVDLRGHRVDIAADHRSAAVRHSVEVLPEWGHRGCNAASHLAVDHRSETAGQVAHRWDHHGCTIVGLQRILTESVLIEVTVVAQGMVAPKTVESQIQQVVLITAARTMVDEMMIMVNAPTTDLDQKDAAGDRKADHRADLLEEKVGRTEIVALLDLKAKTDRSDVKLL